MALTTSTKLSRTQPKLLDQVRAAVRVKHYSYRTEQAYVYWIKFDLFDFNNYVELDLAMKVKSFGGKWDKFDKVWRLPFEAVRALGLENRIVNKDKEVDKMKKRPP